MDPGSAGAQSLAAILTRGGGRVGGLCREKRAVSSLLCPSLGDHSALDPRLPYLPTCTTPPPTPDKGACSNHGDFAEVGAPCGLPEWTLLHHASPEKPFTIPALRRKGPAAPWDIWTWSHAVILGHISGSFQKTGAQLGSWCVPSSWSLTDDLSANLS